MPSGPEIALRNVVVLRASTVSTPFARRLGAADERDTLPVSVFRCSNKQQHRWDVVALELYSIHYKLSESIMGRLLRMTSIVVMALSMAMAIGNHAAAQRLSRFFNQPTTPTQLIATDQVQSELKLNNQQQKRIKEITDQVNRDVRALYSGLSREDRREKQADLTQQTAKLRAAAVEKIDVLLDDAQ